MAMQQRGLGKGLAALMESAAEPAMTAVANGEDMVRQVPLDAIAPNPNQPRRDFPAHTLRELADSIAIQGVLQPILVRKAPPGANKPYELVAGERRWRASHLAGKTHIPCLVKAMDDDDSLIVAIIENLQREDLNPLDEAIGLQQLQERLGLSQEALAQKVGKSRPAVANSLRLLQLPETVCESVRTGRLSAGHARALLAIGDQGVQEQLHDRVLEEDLSVREVESRAAWWREHGVLPEDAANEVAAPRRARAPRRVDLHLAALQTSIRRRFPCKVTVRGGLDKGQVVFTFASPDELDALLTRLGVEERDF